ncbi:MAG: hypothetical protein QOG04_1755 [Actinomycetota bacterium]|nr:hypothetical protein [Actinomycetota bacterium]
MKKLASVLTALFVVVLAAPAFAQTGATAKVTSPNDGQVLTGSVSVGGNGSATAGVKTIKLFIEDTLVASAEPSNLRQNVDVGYSWDTNSFGGGIARNGWYQVRVELAANGGATDTAKVNVMVDNAPQTPSNFDGYVQDETISLSWSANPEPDILGYRIEVANGGTWTTATEVTGTSYSANLQPGTYQFRVSALRSSPESSNGHASAPSGVTTLTIQPPPTSGGSSGGGDGGVVNSGGGGRGSFGGGDPRIYGHDGAASTRDVKDTARAFSSGGLSFGGISLPGQAGLPSLPGTEPFKWGTYKERLPYSLPLGGIPLDDASPRLAALSTTRIIPMDALRWVGAGALMLVIAMMLQFVGWRSETIEKLGTEAAASLKLSIPKISIPAVNLKDAHVRLRRIQDRVRATWKATRGS